MGRYRNLVGERRGRLTIIRDVGRVHGNVLWECVCDCGNVKRLSAVELQENRKKGTKSCGCLQKEIVSNRFGKKLEGQKFGRLTVIKRSDICGKRRRWVCLCDCGNETIVTTHELTSGHTRSCTCLQKEKARKHATELAKIQKKEKHPSWKGGFNSSYDRVIWSDRFRSKIRKRDKFSCQICGKERIGLDIHHIDENTQNCKEDNLITLCRKCHRNVHTGNLDLPRAGLGAWA